MTVISIPLEDERLAVLKSQADRVGLSPEEFLRQSVEVFLARPDEAFHEAASYVLKKNRELYRRLA